jgi:hypothetical protein
VLVTSAKSRSMDYRPANINITKWQTTIGEVDSRTATRNCNHAGTSQEYLCEYHKEHELLVAAHVSICVGKA